MFGPVMVVVSKGDWILKKNKEHLAGLELLLLVSNIFSDFQMQML